MGHVIVWVYAGLCLLDIVRADVILQNFTDPKYTLPTYSIYRSKDFFIAFNVWGIITAGIFSYSLWQNIRILFLISLLMLIVLMFYPYFSVR